MRVRVRGAACTYSSPAICSSESRAQETNATVRVSSLWSGATPSATARAPLLHAPPPSNADISYPAILAEWCTYLLNSLLNPELLRKLSDDSSTVVFHFATHNRADCLACEFLADESRIFRL